MKSKVSLPRKYQNSHPVQATSSQTQDLIGAYTSKLHPMLKNDDPLESTHSCLTCWCLGHIFYWVKGSWHPMVPYQEMLPPHMDGSCTAGWTEHMVFCRRGIFDLFLSCSLTGGLLAGMVAVDVVLSTVLNSHFPSTRKSPTKLSV